MFVGSTFNEFPLCTSEEMTETYNGDDVQFTIFIDKSFSKEVFIQEEETLDVYINQQSEFTLES
jgi:hypothetical protein